MGSVHFSLAALGSSDGSGLSLWIPPVAAVCAAAFVALVAGGIGLARSKLTWGEWIGSDVKAGPAWTLSDSWVTNIAGAGAVLGAVASSLSSLPAVTAPSAAGVTILFVAFGGAAGVAPLVYAATAKREAQELMQVVGSVWGFLLAGATSLVAVMGEIATVALLVSQVGDSGAEKVTVIILLSLGALFVAIYSVRALVLFATPDAQQVSRRSLLGSAETSATL